MAKTATLSLAIVNENNEVVSRIDANLLNTDFLSGATTTDTEEAVDRALPTQDEISNLGIRKCGQMLKELFEDDYVKGDLETMRAALSFIAIVVDGDDVESDIVGVKYLASLLGIDEKRPSQMTKAVVAEIEALFDEEAADDEGEEEETEEEGEEEETEEEADEEEEGEEEETEEETEEEAEEEAEEEEDEDSEEEEGDADLEAALEIVEAASSKKHLSKAKKLVKEIGEDDAAEIVSSWIEDDVAGIGDDKMEMFVDEDKALIEAIQELDGAEDAVPTIIALSVDDSGQAVEEGEAYFHNEEPYCDGLPLALVTDTSLSAGDYEIKESYEEGDVIIGYAPIADKYFAVDFEEQSIEEVEVKKAAKKTTKKAAKKTTKKATTKKATTKKRRSLTR